MPYFPYFNYYDPNRPHLGWLWLLVFIVLWGIVWKGLALWKSARSGQRNWFIALLVINTMGVLDILYLAFFQKKSVAKTTRKTSKKPARRGKHQSK